MRRPPDKDGHSAMTDRDVVSSNATLNAFLGGSRQKSWMVTTGGAPVRPTPRRPSLPKPFEQSAPNPQRSAATPLPPRVTSDEESSVPADAAVPPNDQFTVVSNIETQRARGESQPVHDPPSEALEGHVTTSNVDAGAAPPRPSVDATGGSAQVDELSLAATSATTPLPEQAQHQAREMSETMAPAQNLPVGGASYINMHGTAPLRSLESLAMPPTPTVTAESTSSYPSSRRPRPQSPAMPSLRARIPFLHLHINTSGGLNNLNSALEKPRFNLLENACNSEDAFYIALHQLFCAWDTNRGEVISIPGLPDQNTLATAFRILGQLIRDNDGLAPSHLKWFAAFPNPLAELMANSEPYRRTIHEVGIFLRKLVVDWTNLSKACTSRGYPPLVDELVSRLGLLSPTLQNIVFTATRRNLGIVDDEFGNRMEKIFTQDRDSHRDLAARSNTSHPPTQKEIQERNHSIAETYIALAARQRQKRLGVGLNANSIQPQLAPIIIGSNGNAQPNNVGNLASRILPGPIQTSSRESPRPQPMTINATMTMPGTQAGIPSPITLQGLSMHSPVQQGFAHGPGILRSNSIHSLINTSQQAPNSSQNPTPYYPHAGYVQPLHTTDARQPAYYAQQHIQPGYQQYTQQQQTQYIQQPLQAQPGPQPARLNPAQLHQQMNQQRDWVQQSMPNAQQQQVPLQYYQPPSVLQRAPHLRRDSIPNTNLHNQIQSRSSSVSSNDQVLPPIVNGTMQSRQQPPALIHNARPMATQDLGRQYAATNALKRSFIPPLGYSHPSQLPDPDRTALHQAHIRSPRLVTVDIHEPRGDETSRRYYQFVKEFPLPPKKLTFEQVLSKFEFEIPEHALAHIAQDKLIGTDPLAIREVKSRSLQYRVRGVYAKQDTDEMSVSRWVVTETGFDEMMFLEINKHELEIRRKLHHGKDLPIDVTPYIHAGKNVLTIAIPRPSTSVKTKDQFIAVEEVEILQHDEIMELCRRNRIPAADTLQAIKKSLSGPPDEDDELSMVVSDLSIDLADPFMAKIFEIPVRGNNCLHRECFDLTTFLLTRNSKPKRPKQPSMVDVWKCPLCGADARPYSLRLDEFLVTVRAELEKQNNLDVKAILVAADGTWRPKPEPRPAHKRKSTTGEDGDEDGEAERIRKKRSVSAAGGPTAGNKAAVEVIELDDD
ncbi:miz sp-ring zinc finger protein [Rutstroemia sp. NJR-2017a WRK4]|nr:miz sp-ring zinc finger protein [Rutstroemia sp. NJR-2017a WRK4]